MTRIFGTIIPKNIPESSAWWHQQAKDLYAITDAAENGMMSCMVTITHNDNCGEILANLRRGPFSPPTDAEKCEYLFSRVKTSYKRPDFEKYAFEHTLSYQRRIAETKDSFMVRGKRTPLGIREAGTIHHHRGTPLESWQGILVYMTLGVYDFLGFSCICGIHQDWLGF